MEDEVTRTATSKNACLVVIFSHYDVVSRSLFRLTHLPLCFFSSFLFDSAFSHLRCSLLLLFTVAFPHATYRNSFNCLGCVNDLSTPNLDQASIWNRIASFHAIVICSTWWRLQPCCMLLAAVSDSQNDIDHQGKCYPGKHVSSSASIKVKVAHYLQRVCSSGINLIVFIYLFLFSLSLLLSHSLLFLEELVTMSVWQNSKV